MPVWIRMHGTISNVFEQTHAEWQDRAEDGDEAGIEFAKAIRCSSL